MDATWLTENKFHALSETIYLRDVKLKQAPHLDVHVNLTFEDASFQRCDLHGTIRLVADANRLRRTNDPNAVGRAIWVYSDKTWRSASSLQHWLDQGGMTYTSLKSACRELAEIVREWEYQIDKADCEVLEPNNEDAHKITTIGAGDY